MNVFRGLMSIVAVALSAAAGAAVLETVKDKHYYQGKLVN